MEGGSRVGYDKKGKIHKVPSNESEALSSSECSTSVWGSLAADVVEGGSRVGQLFPD